MNEPPHPLLHNLAQEEPSHPEAQVPAQSQQQYSIKRATDQMKCLRHKPILYTLHETTEKPWSRLESEGTHVAKTNLHKIWAYQRSKGFSGFLNVTKRFFLSFFRHALFLFLLFFSLVWSHKPTEKGLEKLVFQGGNRRRTSFFSFLKKCS